MVEHNLAKVGVGSSSLLSRSKFFHSVFYLKNWIDSAGIAQLVEHNLAKVGVGSSSLLSRSRFKKPSSKDGGFFYVDFIIVVEMLFIVILWQYK